jgi:hypothetical protein
MNRVMPIPTYSQNFSLSDDSFSDDDNEISYENAIRPSQMIDNNGNNSDDSSSSSDGNMIISQINTQRENHKKTPLFINSSLHSFSKRIKVLPESIQKTFNNNNNDGNNNTVETHTSICFAMKTFLKLTVVSIIGVISMLAII